jgi:hypothetical protein
MNRIICCIILLLGFIACQGKNKVPKNILPPPRMLDVMKDMMLADEFVAGYIWKNDSSVSRLEESIPLYEKIFSMHRIHKEQLRKSLAYYRDHPKLFKTVIDSLNIKEPAEPARRPLLHTNDSTHIRKNIQVVE